MAPQGGGQQFDRLARRDYVRAVQPARLLAGDPEPIAVDAIDAQEHAFLDVVDDVVFDLQIGPPQQHDEIAGMIAHRVAGVGDILRAERRRPAIDRVPRGQQRRRQQHASGKGPPDQKHSPALRRSIHDPVPSLRGQYPAGRRTPASRIVTPRGPNAISRPAGGGESRADFAAGRTDPGEATGRRPI